MPVTADLGEEDQVRHAVSGAEVVIDLVGIAREREASFAAVHVEGAARVARLAARAGVQRLLHVSALGIAEAAPAAADRTKAGGPRSVPDSDPGATEPPGHRQARGGAARVQGRDPLPGQGFRHKRAAAGLGGIIGLKDRQRAVADQLEHVAAGLVHRRDDRLGIVVQERDDLLGLCRVGDPGEAREIGEPQHRADLLGHAAGDPPAQYALAGVSDPSRFQLLGAAFTTG
jgi:hypothetical protein